MSSGQIFRRLPCVCITTQALILEEDVPPFKAFDNQECSDRCAVIIHGEIRPVCIEAYLRLPKVLGQGDH